LIYAASKSRKGRILSLQGETSVEWVETHREGSIRNLLHLAVDADADLQNPSATHHYGYGGSLPLWRNHKT